MPRPATIREFTHHAHTVSDIWDNFSGKWSPFEALVHTVPWWKLLGEELWQGVRAPLGELTCSNKLKDDKSLHINPNFASGYTVHTAVSGTALGKNMGANST